MAEREPDGVVVDDVARTIRIRRTYAAGVDRAWWAWTDPVAISAWWGPRGWVATVHEMDVRPGGRWRFEIAPEDGSSSAVRSIATYVRVAEHAELAYDDEFADETWTGDGSGTFPTSVTFSPSGSGSTVQVAAGFPDDAALQRAVELQMAEGYAEALDRLADVLAETDDDTTTTTTHRAEEDTTMTVQDSTTTTTGVVRSADGTEIAYEITGSGPAIVVVSNVAEDRTGVAGLAAALAADFTVVTYDRRGRGASGDPQPYDPAREVDDVAALADLVGGPVALTSGSGGCALVLDVATALGERISGVYLYEPPFIVDDLRPPAPSGYVEHQEALVAAGRRGEAVEYFMTEMIRVPAEYLPMMQADPSWDEMAALAHTYAYDGRILAGLQDGTPLPVDRWTVDVPVAVAVGEHAEDFIRSGAAALAVLLPHATVLTLAGQDHSAFWTAPEPVAGQLREFLLG